MKLSRRNLLMAAGGGAAASIAQGQSQARTTTVHPPDHSGPGAPAARPESAARVRRQGSGYLPVRTLNGWTLPFERKNGAKEFHLVAEEFEHEFAPGCKAKVWGYNGTTPGPTIEVVEGDRVRIFVTNRLREHTTIHWHGIILPSGMDGVGGLTQPHIQPGETYVYEFTVRQHGTHMYHRPICRRRSPAGRSRAPRRAATARCRTSASPAGRSGSTPRR
jgi:FtsP/CotA-like multicopper oxidase with cupredoxin domain